MNAHIELKLTETKRFKATFRKRGETQDTEIENPQWRNSSQELFSLEPHSDGTCTIKPQGPLGAGTLSCVGMTPEGMVGHAITVAVVPGGPALRGGISVVE